MSASEFRVQAREIRTHLAEPNLDQIAEDEFFRASEDEKASADLYRSLIFVGKAQSILIFDEMVRRFGLDFHGSLLELGGGYGFLSSYLKKSHPELRVVYSDVSREAVEKSGQYEEFFGVRLDEKWVTGAESTPFEDGSFDRVLFFASFHHTQDPTAAVRECARVLKPGGAVYMLFEPSCPGYLKPLYDRHVRRDEVKENYYSVGEYRRMFHAAGLDFRQHNYTSYVHRRSPRAVVYYVLLSLVPRWLTNAFPSSQVLIGTKAGAAAVSAGERV